MSYKFFQGTIFTPAGTGLTQLAIAFDVHGGVIFKHGEAAAVEAWAQKARAEYQACDLAECANGLTVLTFKESSAEVVAFVNHAITHTGWIESAWRQMQARGEHLTIEELL